MKTIVTNLQKKLVRKRKQHIKDLVQIGLSMKCCLFLCGK